jgi:hypothetical protein
MEVMADLISDFWGIIIGALTAVVWLVRLEARGISNAAEVRRLWAQRKEDMEAQREQREEANKMLTEIRSDVKDLLRGVGK